MTKHSYESLLQDGSLWFADSDSVPKVDGGISNRQVIPTDTPPPLPKGENNLCGISAVNEIAAELQAGAIHEFLYDKVDTFSAPPVSLCLHIATKALITTGRRLVLWVSPQDLWPSPSIIRMNQLQYAQQNNKACFPGLLGTPYIVMSTNSATELFSLLQLSLRSPCVASVITPSPRITFKQSQALSIAAKSGGVLGIFFSSTRYQSSYHSRWHIRPQPSESPSQNAMITLLKKKGIQSKQRSWDICQQHFATP